jgi:hypothetical protein
MDAAWPPVALALAPVLLGALVALAWRNSHTIHVLGIRLDTAERDIAHLRGLIERQIMKDK